MKLSFRDYVVMSIQGMSTLEWLTLLLMALLVFGGLLLVSDNVEATKYAFSRMDCGVMASKDCGPKGLVSVPRFNESSLQCDWFCRPVRNITQELKVEEELRQYRWVNFSCRLYEFKEFRCD